MLKNIPSMLTPDLLKIMMEMGHGDELVIADGNFPAASLARRLVRLDGHLVSPILDAVLQFFPLDTYAAESVVLMEVVPGDPTRPSIWQEYRTIIEKRDTAFTEFGMIDRFAFYERARSAHAVVATGETALYANVILKKGVVVP
jgi:L-fucose mutarotase